MSGGDKKSSARDQSFFSRTGTSASHGTEKLQGNRDNSTSRPFPENTATTESHGDPHYENAEGSEDEDFLDLLLEDSFDPGKGPRNESESAYHSGSPENPKSSSQPTHSRDARLKESDGGQDHPHIHKTKDRDVDRERSNSPRKKAHSSHGDRVPNSRANSGVPRLEDDDRHSIQDFTTPLPSTRHQSTSDIERTPNPRSEIFQGRSNGDEYRYDRIADPTHQGAKNHAYRGPSRPTSEPASSTHSSVQQDGLVPQIESPDPTTRRIEKIAIEASNAIHQDGGHNFDSLFWRLIGELTKEIKQSEDKANALSKEMLDGRDRYQPIPDGIIQESMNQLRSLVKVLAQDIGKAQTVQTKDLRPILQENLLTDRIHHDAWGNNKKYLIQSAIWKILKTHFFQGPFQLYGEEGFILGRTWTELFFNGKQQNTAGIYRFRPTELSERWKSLTATRLSEKYEIGAEHLEKARQAVLETLADPISAGTLMAGYSPQSGWGWNLQELLRSASKLAIVMSSQRSRLELYVPDIMTLQKVRNAHALGRVLEAEEDEDCSDRVDDLGFVVTPGLRRRGDGLGSNLQHHVDLEAARVRCIE